MFSTDTLIADCIGCLAEPEPRAAVRDVLSRVVARPEEVGDVLRPELGGIEILYVSPQLTVLHAVWAPGMSLYAHDHRMWAAIGVYAGREDNSFFRRPADGAAGLVASGTKQISDGSVLLLGDDTIHSVTTTPDRLTAAIHVYGGDFVNSPRSQWIPPELQERPYDLELTRAQFARANEAWAARR